MNMMMMDPEGANSSHLSLPGRKLHTVEGYLGFGFQEERSVVLLSK